MRRIRHILSLSLLLAAACSSSGGGEADTDTDGTTGDEASDESTGDFGESRPFRGDWETVIDQPFSTYAADGTPAITSLTIGNEGGDNFRNRGDVIVQYADTDRITVEMRPFTMTVSQTEAQADFDLLSIWASTTSLPAPPYERDPAADCADPTGQAPWRNGCRVAVFFNGQNQVDRSGADIRVTLPSDFIFDLTVVTEDNDVDADYQNRGNVCIENLPGSADVTLSNGQAWVILDPSTPEIPECPDAMRTVCEDSDWDPSTCACFTQGFLFSGVRVVSNDGQAADATVDVPGNFWVGYNMRNDAEGLPGNDELGASCEATVDDSVGAIALADSVDLESRPGTNQGSINYPGEPATLGAGYSILLTSDHCSAILSTEDPMDFAGPGTGPMQVPAERGNLQICSGCVRAQGCASLIPGG